MSEEKVENIGKVICVCSCCGKKHRNEDANMIKGFVATAFMMQTTNGPAPSLPILTCMRCGGLTFANESMDAIRGALLAKEQADEEGPPSMIIKPPGVIGAKRA